MFVLMFLLICVKCLLMFLLMCLFALVDLCVEVFADVSVDLRDFQTLLLCGRYSEDTSSMQSNSIVKLYKDVIEIHPEWEDGHFYLAKYYDKIMTTIIDDKDRPEKQG